MRGARARSPASAALVLAACALAACASLGPLQSAPPIPNSVGATPWQLAEGPPEAFAPDAAFESPWALMDAFVAYGQEQAGPDTAVRGGVSASTEGRALGWVHVLLADDSVAGTEIELAMGRDEGGWFVTELRYRSWCRRGIDQQNGLCV